MTAGELIKVLEAMGFTPEEYDSQLYSDGSYYADNSNEQITNHKIEAAVGAWREIEKNKPAEIKEYGYTETRERTILHFIEHNIYLAANVYSGSYGRENWTNWYQVFPKEVTIYTQEEEINSY